MESRKKKRKVKVMVCFIITVITVVIGFVNLYNYNKQKDASKEENSITITIEVEDIDVVTLAGDSVVYIRDTNEHLFEMDEFDPNALLCDKGTFIKVTFLKEFEYDNIIPVTNVQFYGVPPIND
mgnify:CR=1 FL=1